MKRKKRKLIVQHKMIFDSVKHKQRAELCMISFSYLHFLSSVAESRIRSKSRKTHRNC